MSEEAKEVRQAQNVVTSENLQEFQLNKLGIKPEEVKEQVKEEVKESVKDEIHVEDEDDGDDKKEKHPLKERFSKLTKQRNEAREEAARNRAEKEAIEAKLKEYETKSIPAKQEEGGKPNPAQFTDAFEYAEKLAEWSAKEAIRNKEERDREQKNKEVQDKTIETWRTRLDKAKAEIEDYDDIVASSDVSVSDQVRDAILESEYGPQILYQLASNEDIAEKIGKMSVASALREIGKLEAKFDKGSDEKAGKKEDKKVEVSKAPEPVKPISGGKIEAEALDSKGEVKVDFATYKQLRKAGKLK